ncbi:MAG: MinD/ParA family protein [bacterium]
MDQASSLRRIVHETSLPTRKARVLSVTSGKGGVGKTNVSINLACALAEKGRQVYLLDADLGLANIDVLLNLTPAYTIEHVLSGEKHLREIVVDGPSNIKVLPSSSGVVELADLGEEDQQRLIFMLEELEDSIDYLIIDTGAGISSGVLRFNVSADEVLLVATPDPSSLTDAYSTIKVMVNRYNVRSFNLIANSVSSQEEGRSVFERLQKVTRDFLQVELNYLGFIPRDTDLAKSVRMQKPLLEAFPQSPAAKSIRALAHRLDQSTLSNTPLSDASFEDAPRFWERFLQWKERK